MKTDPSTQEFDGGCHPATRISLYSENLLAIARAAENDRRHAYALLERAVAEGAIRLIDHGVSGQNAQGLPSNVPRQIVQYWHAEKRPEDVQEAILKVQECNLDMACTVFHEESAREFVAGHFGEDMRSLFDFCFHHAMKSDLFRLCYLHVHGGIYIDVDVNCHGPLENILVASDFGCFLFYAEGKPWCVENGFIVSEPANGLIAAMIGNLERNLVQFRDKQRFRGIWAESGPGLATETMMGLLARYILHGEGAALVGGFLMSRNDRSAISYVHDELEYKRTAEGNWRKARPPGIAFERL
jgi:hypothetical protein